MFELRNLWFIPIEILLVFSKSFMPSFRSFSFLPPDPHHADQFLFCDVVSTFHTKILCFIGVDCMQKVDDICVL